jgi:hypothetical protein
MKIFGFNFTTKKELKKELAFMKNVFPFEMGQTVYDIVLKDSKGRYSKKDPSFDHCEINEVVVSEKNYFSLVTRLITFDVFKNYDDAVTYIKSICK